MKPALLSVLTIAATALMHQPADACCLLPFFPTYAAGYGYSGWGAPVGYGYAPAAYGYGYGSGYGGFNSCSSCNSCGGGTAVNYGATNCCGSSCGGCNNCSAQPFSSSKPSPDPNFDRTEDKSDYDRDRTFGTPDRDSNPDREDRRDETDDFNSFRERNPLDDSSTGRGSRDRDLLNDRNRDDWEPRGSDPGSTFDRGNTFDSRDSSSGSGSSTPDDSDFRQLDQGLPDFDDPDFNSRRPVIEDTSSDMPDTNPVTEQSVRKPPTPAPVEEDMPTPTNDAVDSSNVAPANGASTVPESTGPASATDEISDEAPIEPNDGVDDFLAPENTDESAMRFLQLAKRNLRTNHRDGVRNERLAGRPALHTVSARKVSQVSSSRRAEQPPRWISLPLPAGRNRL